MARGFMESLARALIQFLTDEKLVDETTVEVTRADEAEIAKRTEQATIRMLSQMPLPATFSLTGEEGVDFGLAYLAISIMERNRYLCEKLAQMSASTGWVE